MRGHLEHHKWGAAVELHYTTFSMLKNYSDGKEISRCKGVSVGRSVIITKRHKGVSDDGKVLDSDCSDNYKDPHM